MTNGSDTKDIAWYITGYATKGQGRTHNLSGILGHVKNYSNPGPQNSLAGNTAISAEALLVKFANAINSCQEISAPMAIASMEGWAPVYTPHLATNVFLSDVHHVLHTQIMHHINPNIL
jgi:hypothetical protein